MKKPLPTALPLCFGLPLLALWLSLYLQHTAPARRPAPPTLPPRVDTIPSTTIPPYSSRVRFNLCPALLHGHHTNINLEWQTLVNGQPAQKGFYLHHNFSATGPTSFDLPLRLPNTNDEIILLVTGRLAAAPGHAQNAPLFIQRMPQHYWRGDHSIPAAGDLSFTDSNNTFTITSDRMQAQFDKQTGWLLHYEAGGALLMGDSAGLRTDLGPADTMLPHLQLFFASTGPQIVIVKAEYTVPGIKCLLHLSYNFNAAGDMLVEQVLEADTAAAPERFSLPHFGMSWLLPHALDSAASFADDAQTFSSITAPVSLSREEKVEGVRWLILKSHNGQGMRIVADSALLQMYLHPADSTRGPSLGMYKIIDSVTQRRFNYSYKVMSLTPATSPASHPPAHAALPAANHPAHVAKPI